MEFLIGDVYLSTTIFSCAPGIVVFLFFFGLFLYSTTIFYFFFCEFYRILNVFSDFDWRMGDSSFVRIRFDIGCLGELFLIFLSSEIITGFFNAFKSYTRLLRILFLYSSERYSNFIIISDRFSISGIKICFSSSF